MTRVLLTGFEPFGGDASNPSEDAVRAVAAAWDRPDDLLADVLPVTFAGAEARLRALITAERPDVVVAVGLAGGRAALSIERVALNLIDARIPDNDGAAPVDVPSVPGAPLASLATAPVKAMAAAVRAAGVPAEVSLSAGTFVCNHVFTVALHAAPDARVTFVHVPWDAEHAPAGAPSLPLADIVSGLRAAIDAAIDADEIGLTAGTLS